VLGAGLLSVKILIFIISTKFVSQESKESGTNAYAVTVEECYGLDKIEFLQSHENLDIYQVTVPFNFFLFVTDGGTFT
jgi:hypothetical protein